MKKNIKKALAISVLSMGVLSSAPTALYASGGVNRTNGNNGANVDNVDNVDNIDNIQPRRRYGCIELMVSSFHLNRDDFVSFLSAFEERGGEREAFKINPVGISSLKDIREYLPNIETFEDYHQLTPGENRNNHVNSLNEGHIKTLIYYPGSFDAERFRTILEVNGVDVLTPTSRGTGLWKCEIKPFNGMYYRVEYIKNYTERLSSGKRKKIVFLFRPSNLIDRVDGKVVESFNRLLEDYGLRDAVDVNHTLQKFIIPYDVKSIDHLAFRNCTSLREIGIPDSVKYIGIGAFEECKSLKEVIIPNSIKCIGYCAFRDCTSLEKVIIPESVIHLGIGAFYGCTSLKEVKIYGKITRIDEASFEGCTSLKEIEIPNSVTEIDEYAFRGCTSLKIRWNEKVYDTVAEFFADFNKK